MLFAEKMCISYTMWKWFHSQRYQRYSYIKITMKMADQAEIVNYSGYSQLYGFKRSN